MSKATHSTSWSFNGWALTSGIIGVGTIMMWCYLWWFDQFLWGSPSNSWWLIVVAGVGLVLGMIGLRRSQRAHGEGRSWAVACLVSNGISLILGAALIAGPLNDPFFGGYESPTEPVDADWAEPVYDWAVTKVSASGESGYCVISVPEYPNSWKLPLREMLREMPGVSVREQIVLQGLAEQAIGADGYEFWAEHRDEIDMSDPYWEEFPMSEIPDDALTPDVSAVVASAMADACEEYMAAGE